MSDYSFDDNSSESELSNDNASVNKSLNDVTITKPFVFFTDNNETSLHFIICHTSIKEQIRLKKLIEKRTGSVSFSLNDFGPHSVVLIEDDAKTWEHSKDVFKLSYIDACIKENRIVDILPFLHFKSSDLVADFPYMDVFYYKKFSWFNIPARYKLATNSNSDECMSLVPFKCLNGNGEAANSSSAECMSLVPFKCLDDNGEAINSNSAECMSLVPFKCLNDNDEATNSNSAECMSLVPFKCLNDNGEATNSNSAECMSLVPFKCLDGNGEATNSNSAECMSLVPFKCLNRNDEANSRNKFTNLKQLETISRPKFGQTKRTRMKYATKENEAILKYIVENDLYEHVKGVSMWKEMEAANICPIRTWQSMKEHVLKTLSKELNKYKFMTPKDRKLLHRSLHK